MVEAIRIHSTDLNLGELEQLLRDFEPRLFREEQKRITGITLADPAGPDAGRNIILIDSTGPEPPPILLRQFPRSMNENQLVTALEAVETNEGKRLRCYGNVLVSNQPAVVAIFDSASPPAQDTIVVEGKMSCFGGPDDLVMRIDEDLAWIETEAQAAAYPGFFLPRSGNMGFGRRLRTQAPYLACRWDYGVTPKSFLALSTTWCTVTNPATGKAVKARPIDFGPHEARTGGRVADLSPGVADALSLKTDEFCRVEIPTPRAPVTIIPPRETAVPVGGGKRRVVFLTGDYVGRGRHFRQRQAESLGCAFTVDFHFNSNGPTAQGCEVYHRTDDASRAAAARMLEAFRSLQLRPRSEPVKPATAGEGRAAFIESYKNTAILLEPLFVSNPDEARWLHDRHNLSALATAVSQAIIDSTADGALIGLSIGHLGKDSSPRDRGADCVFRDMEATHAEALAREVARLLTA